MGDSDGGREGEEKEEGRSNIRWKEGKWKRRSQTRAYLITNVWTWQGCLPLLRSNDSVKEEVEKLEQDMLEARKEKVCTCQWGEARRVAVAYM